MVPVALDSIGTDFVDTAGLAEFATRMLASLGRSDQRRWGELYVRGLVTVPGRKSIRRICELVVGQDAEQSLQQFVNQSPWDWVPVRRALAAELGRAQRPTAWIFREVVFPKNGDGSVGVARQYAPSVGRVVNGQLALSVFLAGDAGSAPVNWRLRLPPEWNDDERRRLKCRVPEAERSRPTWRYVLDAIDEMIGDWGLPKAPVIVDLSGDRGVEQLLSGLEQRGLGYLVQVPSSTPLPAAVRCEPVSGRRPPATAGQLAAASARRGGARISWPDQHGQIATSLFTLATVPGSASGRLVPRRSRQVLAEWSGTARPRTQWLTNLGTVGVLDLAGLARTWARSADDVRELVEHSGLLHFEGRSFPGWQHHVTLAAMAHAFRLLTRLENQQLGAWHQSHLRA